MADRGTQFAKLNEGWNAEPNAPNPEIHIQDQTLVLTFYLNHQVFPGVKSGNIGELRFNGCWRYRLGPTNDEGWWMGQCRCSLLAPKWGEFYHVDGDLRLDELPSDAWISLSACQVSESDRHYLLYFKDETFECDAADWSYRAI